MKKTKIIILLSAVFAMVLISCGGSKGDAGAGKKNISVVLMALDSSFWHLVESGAAIAGRDLDVNLKVLAPRSESDIEGQIRILEDLITKKVDALIVAPNDRVAVIPILKKAEEAGITVICIDTPVDGFNYVGASSKEGGKSIGAYIGQQFKPGDKIAILRGLAGAQNHTERSEEAKKEIEKAGLVVVTIQPADSSREKAVSVTENILGANPDVVGFYATNDEMALGALVAIKNRGSKAVVFGYDASADALTEIKKDAGFIASLAQTPDEMGYQAVASALKKINGETIPKETFLPPLVVDKSNAGSFEEKANKTMEEGQKIIKANK